ncbi:MAG TPA: nuclear transport factor 2 family protein [Gemmatimonadales bacterium]|nr:nuclear transport factor 2 family protein [Gemmatimonadales bacterium]
MRPWRAASAPAGAAQAAEASVAPPARRPFFPVATAAALVLAACAARGAPRSPLPYDPLREAAVARDVVTGFIAAESRGDSSADTLLAPGADFIATGIAVTRPPRLAAVLGRGAGSVEDVRIQIAGEFAWVVAIYQWTGAGAEGGERGRATMILERRGARWRIRHVHSSTVEPWR